MLDNVVADFPVTADGLSLINNYEDVYIYKNSRVMERARVELNNQSLKPAKILARTANQVTIEAEGPGQLVISEIDYPGWEVWVDGNRGVIETEAGLLRSVELEDGTHLVKFLYRPGSLFLGVMLGFGGIFFLGVTSIHILKRKVEEEIQTK